MAIKVAVIGAGAAGLASARRLNEDPKFSFVVYEQTDSVGGTWVYDERTGVDEFGLPIHTSMYKSLRTNLPKEVMGFPDFPITKPADRSYIPAANILSFLKEFTQAFGLYQYIQFRHVVRKITRNGNGWTVKVENLNEKKILEVQFDAIMICNGHYRTPNLPSIPGQDVYKGLQIHSHDYRVPEFFQGMTVVVIGAGPSGLDIGLDLTSCCKWVYLSHHSSDQIDTCFPSNFTFKPDVKELSTNTVFFVDGTSVEADCILYCTGYLYQFPFLSEDSGVKVRDNYVHPLYKHVIAIESPSMAFIGLPFYVCAFSMFDLQARFFLASLTGKFKLPSREQMLEDEKQEMMKRKKKGFSSRDSHKMGPLQYGLPVEIQIQSNYNFTLTIYTRALILSTMHASVDIEKSGTKRVPETVIFYNGATFGVDVADQMMDYYDDLSNTAQIEGLPHVLTKLHNESSRRFLEDLINFRKDNYIIVDENNFQEIK